MFEIFVTADRFLNIKKPFKINNYQNLIKKLKAWNNRSFVDGSVDKF